VHYKEGIIIRVKHFYRIVSYRRQSRRIMQSFLFRSFVNSSSCSFLCVQNILKSSGQIGMKFAG